MEQAFGVFADYAAAFERTYADDDWSRLTPFFPKDARYEVRGGPFACRITGRERIFAGLRKSINGFDRRCSERKLELTDGPHFVETEDGGEVSISWRVTYQYRDAPTVVVPGRSVFTIADGMIVAMRDEYNDRELEDVGAWMREYGEGLDGSYV
jgi:hypothetical protein